MSAPSELCPALDAREACADWADIISANVDAYVKRLILQTQAEAAQAAFAPIAGETTR